MGRVAGRGSGVSVGVMVTLGAVVMTGVGSMAACSSGNEPGLLGSAFNSAGIAGGGGSSDAGSSSTVSLSTSDNALPGCGVGPDGGVCGCTDIAPLGDPPNLYYVLDRSGSMATDGKWTTVRTVVSNVMAAIGPRGLFAATVFPASTASDTNADACDTGNQVFPLTPGDSPPGTKGANYQKFLASLALQPAGGTPTAATLASLIQPLRALTGKTFVILATDGAPNCSDESSCSSAECTLNIESDDGCSPATGSCCVPPEGIGSNCLDAQATVDSITALKNAGILTYVIGIPGSEAYQSSLDEFAIAGGTGRGSEPQYYAVSTTDQTAIQTALQTVAAKIVGTCTLTLSATPPDPSLVNVYFDETIVPQDPANGWTINGATVTLVGTSCQSVLDGNVLDVRVIAGCPTVLR